MAIEEKDVRKIAKLARLRLSEAEVKLYQGQLLKILDSMEELRRIDTANVAATTSVLGAVNVMREDEPILRADPEKILANAPAREGPYFKVKKVIE